MTEKSDQKPLNICLVGTGSACCLGGLGAYMRYLGAALGARGHRVSAVARFRTDPPKGVQLGASEAPGAFADAPIATRIVAPGGIAAPLLGRLPSLLSRPNLQNLGIGLFNKAYGPSVDAAIADDTDTVHVIGAGWEMLGYAALRRARQIGARLTVLPAVHPGVWGDGDLDIRLYNQADTVFALTEFEKQHLMRRGVTVPITVQGLGPAVGDEGNGARFRREQELADRPLILFVARRVAYKGYSALVEAMETVADAVPGACLIVLSGPGGDAAPPRPYLREIISASDGVKADAFAACDVVCVPSTDESFGLVYVEGWRYQKSVVGGPAPAVQELIEQNVTGRTVAQEPGAIAQTLIDLLSDRELRERLGRAGYARQQAFFTWKAAAQHFEDVAHAPRPARAPVARS